MKALVMHKYKELTYEEVERPEPKAGEVLIRLKACSVCGSDVHGFDGSTGRRKPPIIMGHEASGVIAACGEGVKDHAVGDRVTFDSTVYCNKCDMCRKGMVNLCANRQVLGVSCDEYRRHGCFAEYVTVPEYILYDIPDNVTYVQAAMIEPLSVAYHAATRTKIGPGDTAVVIGVGTIGLLTLQVVKSFGVKQLIAVDIDDKRLELARQNGATDCVNSRDADALEQILKVSDGGVDVALDATGIDATVNMAIRSVHLNGKVVLIGNLAPKVDFPLQIAVTRQLSLFGSCASAGEYPACLDLISSGKVEVDSMISKKIPLAEGNLWMNKIYNREDGLTKIVFLCDENQD
ncbi:MAG: galactitol-1-phosphate 5-dehydrogenase [Clostridia bacterium]|jgi:threonine dehydrogenase-like Zn-dependent dehydrogenase|nr:galactitol-1-phosphate 5-dehydrogenase [Clostridia bacterium]MBQ3650827.1 galactitol-1-phosphate 5-dehydrogenase [Clostridia bacterium]MBQ6358965.1 galactitol-1-phosphate 5-dehydrogenase [Clostridia bacterium]MBQ6866159.1 galactitol-1-phosphate 5-dehydrogenase [Clostridia bacterium]MBQ7754637.1 galactitol-1-phosphate 5-dehydrogenase [Clostridia bacterium]